MAGLLVWLIVALTGGSDSADAAEFGVSPAQQSAAPQVSQVAADAAAAAQDLDVEAALDLMCAAPSQAELGMLQEAIADGRAEAGTDSPPMTITITDVVQTENGGEAIVLVSGEDQLEGAFIEVLLTMGTRGGGDYCVFEVKVLDGDRA